jgi:hypothetical protein
METHFPRVEEATRHIADHHPAARLQPGLTAYLDHRTFFDPEGLWLIVLWDYGTDCQDDPEPITVETHPAADPAEFEAFVERFTDDLATLPRAFPAENAELLAALREVAAAHAISFEARRRVRAPRRADALVSDSVVDLEFYFENQVDGLKGRLGLMESLRAIHLADQLSAVEADPVAVAELLDAMYLKAPKVHEILGAYTRRFHVPV